MNGMDRVDTPASVYTPTPASTPTPTPTPASPQPHPHGGKRADFLSFADKRRQCASVPVFSERPAIVRVISEVKMSEHLQSRGLRTASAMDDLSQDSDSNIRPLTWSDGNGATRPEMRDTDVGARGRASHMLEPIHDVDSTGDEAAAVMVVGGSSGSEDEDSSNEETKFPSLEDVTDLDVSKSYSDHPTSSLTSPGGLSSSKTKEGEVKKTAKLRTNNVREEMPEKTKTSKTQGPLRSSLQKDAEEKAQLRIYKLGQGHGGRRSCPQPIKGQMGENHKRRDFSTIKPRFQQLKIPHVSFC